MGTGVGYGYRIGGWVIIPSLVKVERWSRIGRGVGTGARFGYDQFCLITSLPLVVSLAFGLQEGLQFRIALLLSSLQRLVPHTVHKRETISSEPFFPLVGGDESSGTFDLV